MKWHPSERRVMELLNLSRYAPGAPGMTYLELRTLSGFSHRTLQRAVKSLTASKHIKRSSTSAASREVRVVLGKRSASPATGPASSPAPGNTARASARVSSSGAAPSKRRKRSAK